MQNPDIEAVEKEIDEYIQAELKKDPTGGSLGFWPTKEKRGVGPFSREVKEELKKRIEVKEYKCWCFSYKCILGFDDFETKTMLWLNITITAGNERAK